MPSESGYSNTKKLGTPQHKTLHDLGSSRIGQHVVSKALAERNAVAQAIVAVTQGMTAKGQPVLKLQITSHGAKKGDILRFTSGPIQGAELEILKVYDVDNICVHDLVDLPTIGDTVKAMYYVTSKSDAEGNVNFSPGPTQFVRNGSSSQVVQDTAVPANNKPLPAGLYFIKDGVAVPVRKDSVTPSNTAAMPVEIVAADGTNITLTAGDINIQLSDLGANFDATRIGDGTGFYLKINSDGSANVKDPLALAQLTALVGKDFATETTLVSLKPLLGAVNEATPALDTDSSGLNGGLKRIAARLTSLLAKFPTSLGQLTKAGSLSVTLASDQGALAVTGPLTDAQLRNSAVPVSGPLTDTQLRNSAIDIAAAQLPATLGQKSGANSLSVVFASGTSISTTVTGMSTEAKQDAEAILIGALTETAPATDIASSGLNGRLQRIAQNITSNIAAIVAMSAKLPATLGAKTSANSLSVVLSSDSSPLPIAASPAKVGSYQEIVNLTTTAQTITAPVGAKWMKIQADGDNSSNLRIKLGATATISSGLRLEPARSEDFEVAGDISVIAESGTLNKVYVIFGV